MATFYKTNKHKGWNSNGPIDFKSEPCHTVLNVIIQFGNKINHTVVVCKYIIFYTYIIVMIEQASNTTSRNLKHNIP